MKIDWQRAVAYVVAVDGQHQILLTQFEMQNHPHSGAWTLPGGGMEWGEQPDETALRELKEETGLTANIGPLLGVQSEWFDETGAARGRRGLALRLIYEAQNCAGKLKEDFEDDDTTVDAAWFPVDDIKQLNRVAVVDFGIAQLSKTRPINALATPPARNAGIPKIK